jgi:hypothetical protein
VKLDALDHPKTLDFAARLGVELPTAIGHLELLWAFTGKKSPRGDIGKWPDGAIARACYWMGRPELFTQALRESGFIDPDAAHRLTVHDWPDHAPRWVKAKLAKAGQTFIQPLAGGLDPTTDDTTDDTVEPTTEAPSKGREGKTREEQEARERALATPGLDREAFTRWEAYRRSIRKPIKPASLEAAAQEMAELGDQQAKAVQHSIANSYQGLFTKGTNGKQQPPQKREREPTPAEIAAERRKAAEANAAAMQKLGLTGALKGML